MCSINSNRLALYIKYLKALKSQLFYMALLLMPAVLLSTSDYYLIQAGVHPSPEIQILSSDSEANFTKSDLHLGVGNTTEAQRVDENSKIETRVKSQESESFKVFAVRNNFIIKSSCYRYANRFRQYYVTELHDPQIYLHKLQI